MEYKIRKFLRRWSFVGTPVGNKMERELRKLLAEAGYHGQD